MQFVQRKGLHKLVILLLLRNATVHSMMKKEVSMMKKMLSVALTLVLMVMLLSTSALASHEEDMVGENIVYQIYDYHWEGKKLYVRGCIANLNKAYDLLGMEDVVMVLTDSAGLELCYININDGVAKNCILRPQSKIPYNFTVKNLLYDRNDYTSLTFGLQVRFVSFSYQYAKCEGTNCQYCYNNGYALNADLFAAASVINGGTSSSNTVKCYMCHNGKCPGCDGSGKLKSLKGSILGDRCRTCEGNGKCPACGGDGIMGN